MTKSRRPSLLIGILLLSALLLSAPALSRAGEKARKSIAFLPFTIHAGQNLSYLREGLRDMLASRLAANAGAVVIAKARVDKALQGHSRLDPKGLIAIGRALGADYLVTGSFTVLGGSVSLDASVYQPAKPGPPQRFYATAATEGKVIRAVDQLAWNMAGKLFQVKEPAEFQPAAPAAPAAQGSPGNGAASLQTAHPERFFLAHEGAHEARPLPAPSPRQGFLVRPQASTVGFKKTRNFDFSLQAFDTGDVDGDGTPELVLADGSTVHVYRRQSGQLHEMARIPVAGGYRIHWISIADVDGNGRPEIYISAASPEGPGSMAVEWDGKRFVTLFQGVRWYIRAMELPGEGPVLLGQRPAVGGGVLLPGLYRLSRKGHALEKGRQLSLPDWVNLFDFNLADVNGDGKPEIIHITQDGQLQVARRDGKILWRSDEDYDGTTRFLGGQPLLGAYKEGARYSETGSIDSKRFYVPSRILVADLNGDKVPDIIISRNKVFGTKILKNLRSYTSGEIYALSWNGVGMAELWHTRKIDGTIVDYQLWRNGKQDSLYVGLELGGGFLSELTGRESTVLAFPLDDGSQAGEK